MKDKLDTKTGNLLASPGARRQARYADRQRAAGRRQVAYWLTDNERAAVDGLITQLRRGADHDAC